MHMANELLSVPVATGTLALAGASIGFISAKARDVITSEKLPLMGVLGAFVFAGQMVNFPLPAMPGTSGHLIGAVLLAIILGPHPGAIVVTSVVIVQCLIFQDGGLLALGCNIINMAVVPAYLGYYIYNFLAGQNPSSGRLYLATVLACFIGIEAAAALVPIQATLSGVLDVPFTTFLGTMLSVHAVIGLCEGVITVAVLGYIQQVRPDVVAVAVPGKARLTRKSLLWTLAAATVVVAAGLSLMASEMPDGLEWSYAERPDDPDFKPLVNNENPAIEAADKLQAEYSALPDYSRRAAPIGKTQQAETTAAKGWTSFAGVLGAAITMVLTWLAARLLRKKDLAVNSG
jgi:cobalt/nickel transport system permease protein